MKEYVAVRVAVCVAVCVAICAVLCVVVCVVVCGAVRYLVMRDVGKSPMKNVGDEKCKM